MTESNWAIVARLVRSQGRHGEILAEIHTDFPERFAERKRLFLLSDESSETPVREITLESHWLHKDRVVLKFAGVDSINDTEPLRGLYVAIPASERTPLPEDEVYISDLIGCELFDHSTGRVIGKVDDFDRGANLLIVREGRNEHLVPFANAYIETIDLSARRIEMRLPAGLLEINAPLTADEKKQMQSEREG
ncbi:ribosome maturation factor RimM [Silvibacterium acidisoli]|uniref:ribosome maturation factor RimM n=1 Tax=Acidobacteriaceae bacterium ZG23-2 TaxID=2883246 RepID=UPI00406C7669